MNMNAPEVQNGRATPQPGPFGYSFLSPMDTPYEPAPAPPPGPALLDDNESNMLDNFFTTMNSDHLDTGDFWLRSQQNKSLGTFNFEWSDELPPTFEGSTTSLSQPAFSHPGLDKSMGMIQGNVGTSSDILAAASMLYQNGLNGNEFGPTFSQQPFPNHNFEGMNGTSSSSDDHIKNLQNGTHGASKNSNTGFARERLPVGFHTSEMLFDVHQPVSVGQQASAKPRTLHWGSDISFMDQGYIAPPNQPNEEQRTKELLNNLECLEPQSSAANTRAPSPERATGSQNPQWAGSNGDQAKGLRTGTSNSLDDGSQPKKRQKVSVKEEDDEDSDGDGSRPRSRKSKGSSHSKFGRGLSDTSRKSKMQHGTKSVRENLTEEQKRTNHILSEQKRRNLIRQGFDDLCSLVPGLRGGGFSKSAMLTQAADWLEEVLRGNEILRAQLAELKAMNGLVMPR